MYMNNELTPFEIYCSIETLLCKAADIQKRVRDFSESMRNTDSESFESAIEVLANANEPLQEVMKIFGDAMGLAVTAKIVKKAFEG